MEIFFSLTRNVKMPNRGDSQAAGIDIYVPEFDDKFINDYKALNQRYPDSIKDDSIVIKPNERVLIPSGLYTKFEPKNSALYVANKSGVSSKKGVHFLAHVIDSNYAGEILVNLVNDSNETVTFNPGDKFVQLIHAPIYLDDIKTCSFDELKEMHKTSERGAGGFGSTGNK